VTLGTYGLSTASSSPLRLGGTNLQGLAAAEETEATSMARAAAEAETARNLENKKIEREKKAGRAQLGSTVGGLAGGAIAGATMGSSAGPWGAAIGAVIGGLAGGL